jgi:hypothetical protein
MNMAYQKEKTMHKKIGPEARSFRPQQVAGRLQDVISYAETYNVITRSVPISITPVNQCVIVFLSLVIAQNLCKTYILLLKF